MPLSNPDNVSARSETFLLTNACRILPSSLLHSLYFNHFSSESESTQDNSALYPLLLVPVFILLCICGLCYMCYRRRQAAATQPPKEIVISNDDGYYVQPPASNTTNNDMAKQSMMVDDDGNDNNKVPQQLGYIQMLPSTNQPPHNSIIKVR